MRKLFFILSAPAVFSALTGCGKGIAGGPALTLNPISSNSTGTSAMNLIALVTFFMPVLSFSASVLIIEPEPKGCQIKKMSVSHKKEEILLTTESCPNHLLISNSGKIFYSEENGSVFSWANKKRQKIGNFPAFHMSLLLDEKERLVVGYLKEIQDSDYQNSPGVIETFTFEGKKYATKSLPEWGAPYMAIAEIFEDGKWTRVEVAPTKSGAGETPGLSVLTKLPKKSSGISLEKLLSDGTCMGELNCNSQSPIAKKLLGEREGYGEIQTKSGNLFLFNVIYGDSPHSSSPVFFKARDAKDGIKIDEKRTQISLSVKDDFVLMGEEYNNRGSRLFNHEGKVVMTFPPGATVVWYP